MVICRNGARLSEEPEDNEIYFVYNHKLFYLDGDIVNVLFNSYKEDKTSFPQLRGKIKEIAKDTGCSRSFANRVWSALNKISTPDYYEDFAHINYLIELVNSNDKVQIKESDITVQYPTGLYDVNGIPLYEYDVVSIVDDNMHSKESLRIVISSDWDVLLQSKTSTRLIPIKHKKLQLERVFSNEKDRLWNRPWYY
jgi:hypothetical protein